MELGDSGRLAIFGCHADGSVYYCHQSNASPSEWSDWKSLGGCVRPETLYAIRNPDGRFEVFGLDSTQKVQHAWQVKAGPDSDWSAWENLGGDLLRLLGVVRPDQKGLLIFGLHKDHGIHLRRRPGLSGAWDDWQVLENDPTLNEWYYSVVRGTTENGRPKMVTCLVETSLGVQELTFTDVRGEARLEGDIILGKTEELLEKSKSLVKTNDPTGIYNIWESWHWPAGILPVRNNKTFPLSLGVLTAWEKNTPVRYVDYEDECNQSFFPDYVEIWRGVGDSWSWVGKMGGRQGLKVAVFEADSSGPHELGHALGLYHEQSRSDRDDYVIIHENKIKDGAGRNFKKHDEWWVTDHGAYNYESIMHYSKNAFASPVCATTIETKDKTKKNVIGRRGQPNEGDLAAVNAMYAKQASPEKGLVRLFRFYFASNYEHLFTRDWQLSSNPKEREKQRKLGCKSEGILGYIFDSQVPGTTPLYQLYSQTQKDCVCTVLQSEVNSAAKLGYTSKTIGYVHTQQKGDRYRLVHRFYNSTLVDHLFTVRPDEIESVRKMPGWVEETGKYGDFYVYSQA